MRLQIVLFVATTAFLVAAWRRAPGGSLSAVAIALWTLWPLGLSALASGVASAAGCTVNAAQVMPCPVAGRDLGVALNEAFLAGFWGMLTALPGLAMVAFWWARRTRARQTPPRPAAPPSAEP